MGFTCSRLVWPFFTSSQLSASATCTHLICFFIQFFRALGSCGNLKKLQESFSTRWLQPGTKHPPIARVRKQNLGSLPIAWSAFLTGAMRSFSRRSSRSTPGLSINHILHRTPLWFLISIWNSLYFKQIHYQNIVFIHTIQTTAPAWPACGRRHTSCIRRLLQAS